MDRWRFIYTQSKTILALQPRLNRAVIADIVRFVTEEIAGNCRVSLNLKGPEVRMSNMEEALCMELNVD